MMQKIQLENESTISDEPSPQLVNIMDTVDKILQEHGKQLIQYIINNTTKYTKYCNSNDCNTLTGLPIHSSTENADLLSYIYMCTHDITKQYSDDDTSIVHNKFSPPNT